MAKPPEDWGGGWIETVLIVILAIMVLITIYLLFEPALSNLLQNFLESIQQ